MHHAYVERPLYTGSAAYPPHPLHHGHALHGFCHGCCHPRAKCCCHRECRKEAKELLVQPTLGREDIAKDPRFQTMAARSAFVQPLAAAFGSPGATGDREASGDATRLRGARALELAAAQVGKGSAFIGGGCCVHLSVEYAASSPTVQSIVVLLVDDAESTVLAWGKMDEPGVGYQVKECVITTKPGADLNVLVVNATARVRWCEIFSC